MRFNKIKENDIANGEGINVSLYTQGCPHHCKGCFNKETWDFDGGEIWTKEHNEKIVELLTINNVNRNLSILGGEPLCEQNIKEVLALCKCVKEKLPKTIIYVWTGYLYEELVNKYSETIFQNIDVLIDGEFEEENKRENLKLRGSTNQRIVYLNKDMIS